MKIDFFAPKNYYGSHILALGGWITLLAFLYFIPVHGDYSGSGIGMIYGIISLIPVDIFILAILIYLLEIFFKSKIKNKLLTTNKIYDFYFDLGIIFLFTPIFWYDIAIIFKPFNLIKVFLIFLLIRLLKLIKR